MLGQIISLIAAASVVSAQAPTYALAPAVVGNPIGASYIATVPEKAGSSLKASLSASTASDGTGVKFSISVSGLPAEGGPFMYHIHEKPVPSNGNCTGTGAHLDPYKRGEVPICDATKPEECQTGDLSGKHGNMTGESWSQEYVDIFLATRPDDPSYFGNLAFVVHLSNKTRIGCGNFTQVSAGEGTQPKPSPIAPTGNVPYPTDLSRYNTTTAVASPSTTEIGVPIAPTSAPSTTASTPAPAEFSGSATKLAGGSAALFAAAAAMLL